MMNSHLQTQFTVIFSKRRKISSFWTRFCVLSSPHIPIYNLPIPVIMGLISLLNLQLIYQIYIHLILSFTAPLPPPDTRNHFLAYSATPTPSRTPKLRWSTLYLPPTPLQFAFEVRHWSSLASPFLLQRVRAGRGWFTCRTTYINDPWCRGWVIVVVPWRFSII